MIKVERREVAAGRITKHASQLAFPPHKDSDLDCGLAAKSSEDFMKTVSDRVPRYQKWLPVPNSPHISSPFAKGCGLNTKTEKRTDDGDATLAIPRRLTSINLPEK
ncbi:hypothetical protein N9D38_04895 [Rubripirellula sp.]|nr:hypothetical protein [Rubripirellula sp.]